MNLEDLPGTGYDLSATIFSPEGRIFQVEYAEKATQNSGTAIGLRGNDGIVLAVENLVTSPLYEPHASSHTFTVDRQIGAVAAGFQADARNIIEHAKDYAIAYTGRFKSPIPFKPLLNEVSLYMNACTQYAGTRPFGASVILGAYELEQEPQLYCIEPSGETQGCFGSAIGKAKEKAKSEMEGIEDMKEKSTLELLYEAARIIYAVHDSDKEFELELSWLGKITNGKHARVNQVLQEKAESYAKIMLIKEEDLEYDWENVL